MLQNIHDSARPWVRAEPEILVAERPPHGDDLIGLAGIDVKRMLEERHGSPRRPALRDCTMLVMHEHSVPRQSFRTRSGQPAAFTTLLAVRTEAQAPPIIMPLRFSQSVSDYGKTGDPRRAHEGT